MDLMTGLTIGNMGARFLSELFGGGPTDEQLETYGYAKRLFNQPKNIQAELGKYQRLLDQSTSGFMNRLAPGLSHRYGADSGAFIGELLRMGTGHRADQSLQIMSLLEQLRNQQKLAGLGTMARMAG